MRHDFRVVHRKILGEDFYQIHRVFYDGEGHELMIEITPATIIGNKAKIMLEDIDALVTAFHQPTIRIPTWDK